MPGHQPADRRRVQIAHIGRVLEHDGLIEKHTAARRAEYELTQKGTALLPIIEEMRRFGHSWLVTDDSHTHAPKTRVAPAA